MGNKKFYKFFSHKTCEYYPCHNLEDINCILCYCPLYNSKCEGKYKMINNKKDCSECLWPHKPESYDLMIDSL